MFLFDQWDGNPFLTKFCCMESRIDWDHPILATVNQFFRFFFQYWCILQLELFASFFLVIDRYKVLSIKFSSSQSILMTESSCSRYVRNSIRHYVVVFWNVFSFLKFPLACRLSMFHTKFIVYLSECGSRNFKTLKRRYTVVVVYNVVRSLQDLGANVCSNCITLNTHLPLSQRKSPSNGG